MIKIHEYSALQDGPALVVFGAIHGNEVCGPKAIGSIIKKFNTQQLILLKGRVIFVPISNPLAFSKNKRYIHEDLNRVFTKNRQPKTYEQKLANVLCDLINRSDVLLDLHSSGAKGPPALFLDFLTKANMNLAKSTGINLAIVGWPKLYKNDKRLISEDTTNYAHSKNKDCILVECGQHKDPNAPNVAAKVISRILQYYGMISKKPIFAKSKKLEMIEMTDLFIKENENDSFSRQWKHLEIIQRGDVIGKRQSGKLIIAKDNCVMILPKYNPLVGKEWFYLGVRKR